MQRNTVCQATLAVSARELFPFTTSYTSETQFSLTILYQELTNQILHYLCGMLT